MLLGSCRKWLGSGGDGGVWSNVKVQVQAQVARDGPRPGARWRGTPGSEVTFSSETAPTHPR